MKEIKSKQMLDTFCERLNKKFDAYCERHEQGGDRADFLTYLIDHNIISKSVMRRYAVMEEFEQVYLNSNIQKSKAVEELADKFNITTRSVWNMLRDRN